MNSNIKNVTHIDNITLDTDRGCVTIIDQSLLPNKLEYIHLYSPEDMWNAIYHLKVRGAPAIGICAGYCMYILSMSILSENYSEFKCKMEKYGSYLNSSRPTAVNLSWAINKMTDIINQNKDKSINEIRELLRLEAINIHQNDIKTCLAISEYGLSLLKNGYGVLTHCNAGPLATSRYGTGQGPLYLAKERGINIKVYADETRPLLQGARLTSYELENAGVDVTLICDNMASLVMKNGWINACMVGCDRVAANGDTANKIGTSSVAILAKHYNIPFYVLGPLSSIDMNAKTGGDIEIELRSPEEIKTKFYEKPTALDSVKCYNPSFDVTDHSLITAIITEKGISFPPYTESIKKLFED